MSSWTCRPAAADRRARRGRPGAVGALPQRARLRRGRGPRAADRARAATVDVAFGGAFYASLEAGGAGLGLGSADLPALIALGREIRAGVEAARSVAHPLESGLNGIYGVIFWSDEPQPDGSPCQRNVTVFANGEVDRSPCGSGTSARLALLDRAGALPRGARLRSLGISGESFTAQVVGETDVAGIPAVVTEVEGSAYRTGAAHFTLDPDDPLGTGFLLR